MSWSKPLYHGKAKLKDFYYCIDRGEFGWGECPYKSYKTTIQVIDDAGKPLSGATVTCETLRNDGSTYDMRQSVSGEDGSTFFYLKGGTYRIGARLGSYGSDSVDIYLNKKPQRVVLCLTRDGQKKPRPGGTAYNITGDPSFGGTKPENQHEEEDDPVYPPGIWKSVTMLNDNLIALIDRNDDLYTCFRTTYVPNNLNENTHGGFSTQLSLAMAGSEKTTDLSTPVKILSHVRELFSNDEGVVYAITQNGDLYTWGYRMGRGKIKINANYNPQEYYRESIQKCLQKTPYKLLSNVQTLGVMEGSGIALLTNGDVYGWETNINHELGVDSDVDTGLPILLMSDVKAIDAKNMLCYGADLKNDGDLYVWGYSEEGCFRSNYDYHPFVLHVGIKDFCFGGGEDEYIGYMRCPNRENYTALCQTDKECL